MGLVSLDKKQVRMVRNSKGVEIIKETTALKPMFYPNLSGHWHMTYLYVRCTRS